MKKTFLFVFLCCGLIFTIGTFSSCAPKYGCAVTEDARTKKDVKDMSTKRGKSNLFPKDMRKKKRKN